MEALLGSALKLNDTYISMGIFEHSVVSGFLFQFPREERSRLFPESTTMRHAKQLLVYGLS